MKRNEATKQKNEAPRFSTDAELKKLAKEGYVGTAFDERTPGLGLRCRETGARSWCAWFRVNGRLRALTLGPFPEVSLAKARVQANAARLEARNGVDPAEKKKDARAAETFGELSARFVEEWSKPRKRSWKRDASTLKAYVLPRWKHQPARELKRKDVKALLTSVPGTVFPNRVRSLLSKVFAFGVTEELLDANPVVGTQRNPERKRDRVLTDDELRKVCASGSAVLQLILLTGQRPEDVKGMRWSEIADGVWTIPAERFKTKRAHTVPLVPSVVGLLEAITRLDGVHAVFHERERKGVFVGEEGKKRLVYWQAFLESLGVPGAKPKDLQRTVRSRMTSVGVTPDIAERIQGHVIPGVRAHYDHYDYMVEKRRALERWASELERILGLSVGKVVAFPAKNSV